MFFEQGLLDGDAQVVGHDGQENVSVDAPLVSRITALRIAVRFRKTLEVRRRTVVEKHRPGVHGTS